MRDSDGRPLLRTVSGVSVDWEIPYGDNLECWLGLWRHVKSVLAPHGKQFAPWITNEGGSDNGPVTDSCEIATLSRCVGLAVSLTWKVADEIEYWRYVGIADRFQNMGSCQDGDAFSICCACRLANLEMHASRRNPIQGERAKGWAVQQVMK